MLPAPPQRVKPKPGPFAPLQRQILNVLLPPKAPAELAGLPPVPHDATAAQSAAQAKRERRRERNRRIAGHD